MSTFSIPSVKLCPAQQTTLNALLKGLPIGSIFRVPDGAGRGKTTVLRELHINA